MLPEDETRLITVKRGPKRLRKVRALELRVKLETDNLHNRRFASKPFV